LWPEFWFVAIHNYLQSGPHRIKLLAGECVHVLEECAEWYYGFSFKNKSTHGIFPKKFVHIMDNVVEKFGFVRFLKLII